MTLASLPLDTDHTHSRGAGVDFRQLRQDFPILSRTVYGRPLVYLDSAASAQKPLPVLRAMEEAYQSYYANVHRGVHALSGEATDAYEGAREKIAAFINARKAEEVVFVRGATEAINLVASSYGRRFLSPGDEVVISHLEHHSNIVPWQMLRDEKGIVLQVVPVDDDGQFLLEDFERLLSPRTKLVSVAHVSNALGTILPVRAIIEKAHAVGARVLLDGCQAAPHLSIDVQDLDVDFYVFSSHKMYGPTAIGALYGKADLLELMPPYQGGGDMIASVSFEKTTFKKPPQRFEAGTPAIVEAVGFGAAADYLSTIGLEPIRAHEQQLLEYATDRLSQLPGLTIHGPPAHKAAIISFGLAGVHPHDIGTFLDRAGVAIRAGHHCAQPLMARLGVAATARASFGLYNTTEEVDALAEALSVVREFFG
ncbi:MAG: cysteine desulfurase [Hyphomicrobiales bacterium]|nr:cysteine desulfurase [Hyphomicrobiales bacterium]